MGSGSPPKVPPGSCAPADEDQESVSHPFSPSLTGGGIPTLPPPCRRPTGGSTTADPSRELLHTPPWREGTSTSSPSPPQPAGGSGRAKRTYWFASMAAQPQASCPEATDSKQSESNLPLPTPQPQLLPEYGPHVIEQRRKNNSRSKSPRDAEGTSQEEKQPQEIAHEHVSSDSDSSSDSSPLREPQAPLVPMLIASGEVVYGITKDPKAAQDYHWAYRKYEDKLDGKEINECTGIVVEYDEVKKSAIILTSAWIICTKKPFDDWSYKDYAPEAKVIAHMLDDTISECRLLYFNKHFDIACFEIVGGLHLQILPLEFDLDYDQDLCVLARNKKMDLICTTVKVKYLDPYEHQHNHYMFIDRSIPKCGTGGALVNVSGNIMGMLFYTLPNVAFIPSSLILKCLRLWRKFGQLIRPKLGLKLRTLEDILLGIGERNLEKGNDSNSEVDVEVGVFHVRKCTRRLLTLSVELCDNIEVFC
uniref:Uncharacterized protein n=1 Tax=Oryza punctata TaxID=4537 RepID=A0A0E0KH32_ORYPU